MPTNGMTIDSLNTVSSLTAQDKVPVWDNESSGEPTRKITAQNFAAAVKTLASLLGTSDVVNNLTSGNPNPVSSGGVYGALTNIKSLTVTHGTINAGTSSTIEDTQLSKCPYVIGYAVSGAYNSDCIPWSYYWNGRSFVSRVRNVGSNNASNIQVLYYYFDLS